MFIKWNQAGVLKAGGWYFKIFNNYNYKAGVLIYLFFLFPQVDYL